MGNLRFRSHHNSIMITMSNICIITHLKEEGAPSQETKYFPQKISNLPCRLFIGHINHRFNRKMMKVLIFYIILIGYWAKICYFKFNRFFSVAKVTIPRLNSILYRETETILRDVSHPHILLLIYQKYGH